MSGVFAFQGTCPEGGCVHDMSRESAGRGRPPAGFFTRRTAEDWLRDLLDQARRGTLPGLVATGALFRRHDDPAVARDPLDRLSSTWERKKACSTQVAESGGSSTRMCLLIGAAMMRYGRSFILLRRERRFPQTFRVSTRSGTRGTAGELAVVCAPSRQHAHHMDHARVIVEREPHAQLADPQPPFGAALQLADVAGARVLYEAVEGFDDAAGVGWIKPTKIASRARRGDPGPGRGQSRPSSRLS